MKPDKPLDELVVRLELRRTTTLRIECGTDSTVSSTRP